MLKSWILGWNFWITRRDQEVYIRKVRDYSFTPRPVTEKCTLSEIAVIHSRDSGLFWGSWITHANSLGAEVQLGLPVIYQCALRISLATWITWSRSRSRYGKLLQVVPAEVNEVISYIDRQKSKIMMNGSYCTTSSTSNSTHLKT